jgi:hypothetical protein
MPARKFSDEQLTEALKHTRSTQALARQFGISDRAMTTRMRAIGVPPLASKIEGQKKPVPTFVREALGRLKLDITDGRAVVFSDAHFQPDCVSTANRALLQMLPDIRPSVLICNGDAFDGSSVSRHTPIFGEERVSPARELRACQERLTEIADAAKGARRIFTLGNHDIRIHSYLAAAAPQLVDLPALDVRHLFPEWQFAWSVWINGDTVIKHRYRSGMYAPANNVKGALGMSFVTGHLHSMKVMPLSSYTDRPTLYGVDTGMLADPEWPCFGYREDSPADWRSGFVVMTWRGGRLLAPELCTVIGEGLVDWRGEAVKVA